MSFEAIRQAVRAEYQRIQRKPGGETVNWYSLSGGGMVKKTWQTVGFFLQGSGDRRLVYEVLYVRARNVSVLRVYWDRPLAVLYATKFSTILPIVPGVLEEASRIFVASSGEICPSARNFEPMTAMIAEMPRRMRVPLRKVLSPVPPPVDLDAIEDAEPPAGADPAGPGPVQP